MAKMGISLSLQKKSKDDENNTMMCPDCKVPMMKTEKFHRCNKCFKMIAEKDYFEKKKELAKKESGEVLERTYNLRNGETSRKRNEPEVIELLDSDEEMDLDVKAKESNETLVESESSNDQKSEFIHKDWLIRPSDLEKMDKMLKRELGNKSPDDEVLDEELILTAKYVRLSGFKNDNQKDKATVSFSSTNGICLSIIDSDNKIKIIIGTIDLKYCACIFHENVHILLMQIKKETAQIYINDLKELDGFEKQYDVGDILSTRLIIILDLKKESLKSTSHYLQEFFTAHPIKNTNRIGFLKFEKAQELLYNSFKYTKIKPDDVEKLIKNYQPVTSKILLKYPLVEQPNCSTIPISNIDYTCLREGEFLNDNIISFYLKYLLYEVLSPKDRERTHIFDTFFYQKLTHPADTKRSKEEINLSAAERRYLRVKNWTRNVNIFNKDFLIIPINKNVHWYLAIVCYPYLKEPIYEDLKEEKYISNDESCGSNEDYLKIPVQKKTTSDIFDFDLYTKDTESADEADAEDSRDAQESEVKIEDNKVCLKRPIILIFDSLQSSKNKRIIATIKEYLECEWNAKYSNKGEPSFLRNMMGEAVRAPLQTNYFDCGIYLLQYVESFFLNPIPKFNLPINLEKWFDLDLIKKKRKIIKELIVTLRNKQNGVEKMEVDEEHKKKTSVLKNTRKSVSDDEEDTESARKNPKKMLLDETSSNDVENKPKRNGQTSLKIINDLKRI